MMIQSKYLMSRIQAACFFIALGTVVFLFSVFPRNSFGQPQDAVKASRFVQRRVQSDINLTIQPVLFKGFSDRERQKAKRVSVNVVIDQNFGRVRALRPNKVRLSKSVLVSSL